MQNNHILLFLVRLAVVNNHESLFTIYVSQGPKYLSEDNDLNHRY